MADSLPPDELAWLDNPRAAEAIRIIDRLQAEGFIAFLAGGCVRDAMLRRVPKDYDVATDAVPDRVRSIFGTRNTLAYGASFGVIGVLSDKRGRDRAVGEPTEVATFRSDGRYSDGRRPDSVHFGDPEADAMRRDFTINGLFHDPVTGRTIDYVNGRDDLNNAVLRTIGDPAQRFDEDKLRMLRAIRFATTLGFDLEPQTMEAIVHHAERIECVSGERIGSEMRRVLADPGVKSGLRLLVDSNLAGTVWPELNSPMLDRCGHALHLISSSTLRDSPSAPFVVALAVVLIASADPEKGLAAIAKRWRLSTEETRAVRAAIRLHEDLIHADRLSWSRLQPMLMDRDIHTALTVATAIWRADDGDDRGLMRCREALALPEERRNPPPLLSGDDLIEMGVPRGPLFAKLLSRLRAQQLDGHLNDRQSAIKWVREQGLEP